LSKKAQKSSLSESLPSPHSDKQALWQSDAIAAPALLCQRPCPLRRSAPALPKGEPWAKRAGFAGCKSLSPWERWHRAAMTERASPSPESRHAAISCLFGRAMLSLRLLFFVSVLALSVTFGDSSPKGGASPHPPGTSSLRASSRRAVVSGRSLAASIWPGETW